MGSQCCRWHCLTRGDDFFPMTGLISHDRPHYRTTRQKQTKLVSVIFAISTFFLIEPILPHELLYTTP